MDKSWYPNRQSWIFVATPRGPTKLPSVLHAVDFLFYCQDYQSILAQWGNFPNKVYGNIK